MAVFVATCLLVGVMEPPLKGGMQLVAIVGAILGCAIMLDTELREAVL
jgi:hypothetical protein